MRMKLRRSEMFEQRDGNLVSSVGAKLFIVLILDNFLRNKSHIIFLKNQNIFAGT